MNGPVGESSEIFKDWLTSKGRFPPLSQEQMIRCRPGRMRIKTCAGEVEIETLYGQDPMTRRWLNPMRPLWGMSSHQELSPVLEEKLCYTATMTGSYESAAQVSAKWGSVVEDSTIHAHVQQAGARAEAAGERRVERALAPATRSEVVAEAKAQGPGEAFSLVIMMDGWMVRERGNDWGLKPPEKQGDRVAWREMKTAIVFRLHHLGENQSGRRMIVEKFYVAYRGDPEEFGRRVHGEALRRGLHQAQKVYVVADGAAWIWNIVEDRFTGAVEVLDFFHASEHLWAVGAELYGEDAQARRRWVIALVRMLKHGQEDQMRRRLKDRLRRCLNQGSPAAPVVERETKYFEGHRHRLHYARAQAEGCPIGSGAMESTCAQLQTRFKRSGQFWTPPGQRHLLALELARRNDDWDEVWDHRLVA